MKNNELISAIRFILLNDWDPIGVEKNSNLNDEYDGYIGSIIEVLMQKSSIEAIVIMLMNIEKIKMGIDNVDITRLYDVAVKLKRIGDDLLFYGHAP